MRERTAPSVFLLLLLLPVANGLAGEAPTGGMATAAAWEALPSYEHGQDMAPLLAIDRAVIESRASVEGRRAVAARLGALLASADTTPSARQYVCLKLRDVGTAAEVPVLARMLVEPETSQIARYALEAIPGDESAAALRKALTALEGDLLVGVINSVGARRDAKAVAAIKELTDSKDETVAQAAFRALGNLGTEAAADFLLQRAEEAKVPAPRHLAVPLLRCAAALASAGRTEKATSIYTLLSREGQELGVRRAALEGLFRAAAGRRVATILDWFTGDDPQRRTIAAGYLDLVPTDQLESLAKRLPELPESSQLALIELMASRRAQGVLPLVMSLAKSDDPRLRAVGTRYMGKVGDASVVRFLVESLAAGAEEREAAQQSLSELPRAAVEPALLAALDGRPDIRVPVIEILKRIRSYQAIDPLIVLAASDDPAVYVPAMDGLRGIADPDKTDIPRLLKLVTRVPRGAQRDEAEKTVVLVCEKLPAGADRAGMVLAVLATIDRAPYIEYLPLLGRLGGPKALDIIKPGLTSDRPEIRDAAVRGLCNWPDAEVADPLRELAGSSASATHRRWALRAYIRVVTLKSDRPASQTLAVLEDAMKLASQADDKRLILQRVAAIRSLEAVLWIAPYLDQPDLGQTACEAILEASRDRSLRSTNQERLKPILEKVGQVSKSESVRERAKEYLLGL